jgi:hypothetical protein
MHYKEVEHLQSSVRPVNSICNIIRFQSFFTDIILNADDLSHQYMLRGHEQLYPWLENISIIKNGLYDV